MTENGNQARHLAAAADPFDIGHVYAADPVTASERAVLGAMILSSAAAHEAAAILGPQHFAKVAHQIVFEAVMRLADAGQPVEPASVLSELAAAGMLTRVGDHDLGTGGVFLHSLMERAGSVGYHAAKVLAAWQQRNVAEALTTCRQIAWADDWDPDVHLDRIRKLIEDATAFAGSTALRPQSEVVLEVLEAVEHGIDPGLPTGYPDLDDAIGGLRPGELIVIGARPGGGKSLLGLCIADYVSTRLAFPVLYSSLEMSEEELTHRRIAAAARVPLTHLTRHQVTDADWEQVRRALDRLTSTQLRVDDTPGVSLAHIRGRLRGMARSGYAARLLVIDYLGLLAEPRTESRQQAVAALARGAKNIAREFAIPVLLAAQVNRSPEARSDKRPGLADLRESGEIEAAADIVLMLYREDLHEQETAKAGEVDVIISKNRQGPLCTVTMTFQGHYGRIVSMGREVVPGRVRGVSHDRHRDFLSRLPVPLPARGALGVLLESPGNPAGV